MYDETNKARAVQSGIYFGAFVSIGVWPGKRKTKNYVNAIFAAGVGYSLGRLYKEATR